MKKVSLKTWLMAARPKTLSASVAPVFIATAMAAGDGIANIPIAIVCLLAALSIQIGTNLANDYYDFKKGTDNVKRLGPTRVTQAGLIKPEIVKRAFFITFAFSALMCTILMIRGGWPLAVIGIISICSGILYTAGPKPLGYIGLGDLFVLIFFGPVAVGGTYYVQSYELNAAVVLAGLSPGLISVAILVVNNLRDMDNDRSCGKRTLAVRFGRTFSIYEYIISIFTACLLPVFIFWMIEDHIAILLSTICLFFAIPLIKTICSTNDGLTLNALLARTGKLLVIYTLVFSFGWLL